MNVISNPGIKFMAWDPPLINMFGLQADNIRCAWAIIGQSTRGLSLLIC